MSDIPTLLVQILARWVSRRRLCVTVGGKPSYDNPRCRPVSNLRADNPWDGLQGRRGGREGVRRAILGGLVPPESSLLLTAAMSEARVTVDPAGNAKLAKNSQGGRRLRAKDDPAAAAVLAVSDGYRAWHANPNQKRGRLRSALVG